ncbi:hypothetical protein B2D07_03530 [Desulfococcus multivorans]|nr:hypothetical protein B2D07_03530 [Desulfococcus multivorans]
MNVTIQEFVAKNIRNVYKYVNFENRLELWHKYFGKENICVRIYEKEQLTEGIFADFLESIELKMDTPYIEPNQKTNRSFHPDVTEFLRLTNKISNEQHLALVAELSGISDILNTQNPTKQRLLLSPIARRDIQKRYEMSNREIAQYYLNRDNKCLFYEPWPDPDEPWEPYLGLTEDRFDEIASRLNTKWQNLLTQVKLQNLDMFMANRNIAIISILNKHQHNESSQHYELVEQNDNWFNKLNWQKDRMILSELLFRLEHYRNMDWDLGDDCFVFYKTKFLIDQYAKFWGLRPTFEANNIFELGLWDGGSVAFWFEYFQPKKHVGIDFQKRDNSPYFHQYVQSRHLEGRIKTYWDTNQIDVKQLRQIFLQEFSEPLDLVIDDASHMYGLTKTSFEVLFPLLRPGGLYIIEDWTWGYWAEFQKPDHPWFTKTPFTQLIFELIESVGTSRAKNDNAPLISDISVFKGFTVVERGAYNLTNPNQFKLNQFITRRSKPQYTSVDMYIKNLTRQLNQSEQLLQEIQNSRAWRLVQKWYAFRNFLRGKKLKK